MSAAVKPDAISVSVKEAAELVGCSAFTMYGLLNSGAIEGRYLGRKRLVLYASLRAYVEGLPQDPEDAA